MRLVLHRKYARRLLRESVTCPIRLDSFGYWLSERKRSFERRREIRMPFILYHFTHASRGPSTWKPPDVEAANFACSVAIYYRAAPGRIGPEELSSCPN